MKKNVKIIIIILVLAIALFVILGIAFPNLFVSLSLDKSSNLKGYLATLSGNPALISWLRLNEGSGTTTYDSVSNNIGQITGATWITGVSGNALNFNGKSSVSFNTIQGNFGAYDFSIGLWLKTSSTRTEFPISKRARCDCKENFWNIRTESNGRISFEVNQGGQYNCVNYGMLTADNAINDNKWHYVLAERKDNILSLYVDAVLSKSQNISGITKLDNTAVFRLGKSGCANPFTGSIDEVKFWNYALSPNEVWEEYNSINQKYCGDGTCQPDAKYTIYDGESTGVIDYTTGRVRQVSVMVEDADTAMITVDGVTESKDEGWAGKINELLIYVQNVVGPNVVNTTRYVELRAGENSITCPVDCINQTRCTDSDGGINYYVKGTTTDSTTSKTDNCFDNNTNILAEYYCINNIAEQTNYKCPNGCLDGACIKQTGCTDSDGGINYNVKGTIRVNGVNVTEDVCPPILNPPYRLHEFYCGGSNDYLMTNYDCPISCLDGACINQTCTPNCAGKTCGDDRCGGSCGTCIYPSICQSGTCIPCTPETDATFCARLGKKCGSATGLDNCGNSRTVPNCGICISPSFCQSGICINQTG